MPVADLSAFAIGQKKFRLQLPQVTLVAVTSVAIASTIEAMQRCMSQVQFGEALFLSDCEPSTSWSDPVEWRRIRPLRSRNDYSHFLLHELHRHVSTNHMLCVQWDGFIINPSAWSPEFLKYDFIGAPWPHFSNTNNVGNGGFSLRSLRLMQACAELNYDFEEAEDIWMCRTVRPILEAKYGIRFAPSPLARRFAFERTAPTGEEFGFHGVFNMVKFIGAMNMTKVLGTLEPELIARNEHWDLLRWALKGRHFGLARQVIGRLCRAY